jgi:hypothetical protein
MPASPGVKSLTAATRPSISTNPNRQIGDVIQIRFDRFVGCAEAVLAKAQDYLAENLLRPFVENHQIGVRLLHGIDSSKTCHDGVPAAANTTSAASKIRASQGRLAKWPPSTSRGPAA